MKSPYQIIKKMRHLGIFLLVLGILIFGIVWYVNSTKRQVPIIFSKKEVLSNIWERYKIEYIEPGTGRTLDKQQNNITTSEGQSYTMLRAVFIGDRETFEQSLKWTEDILRRDDDFLHSWLFGENEKGEYAILNEKGGNNSASDAESDIALSLIFAYAKWNDTKYLVKAQDILEDMWEKEVVMIQGKPVLAANDIERLSTERIIVNPSYFSPYAYRIFAKVDKKHDWLALVESSYDILEKSSTEPLDKGNYAGLPPDWIEIDRKTGAIRAAENKNLTTNYSYDALRIPWRVSLDWFWYGEPRAKAYLESLSFFSTEWQSTGKVRTAYTHDGTILYDIESPAMYGGLIGYFMVHNKDVATRVYEEKLKILYNPDTNAWKQTLGYYDDNWAWFGMALYEGLLPNLAELLPENMRYIR